MGYGYWILVWDGWGIGLSMLNPRFLENKNGNFWPCEEGITTLDIELRHKLADNYKEWRILFP